VWFDDRLELSHADFIAKVGRNVLGRWPFVEGRLCVKSQAKSAFKDRRSPSHRGKRQLEPSPREAPVWIVDARATWRSLARCKGKTLPLARCPFRCFFRA
jgi:hypothetical protein